MSRSYRLKSPAAISLPAAFERDLISALGLAPGQELRVGKAWSPAWRDPVAYIGAPPLAAELRRRGWSASAIRAVVFRLNRYGCADAPSAADLRICRRAYRRVMRRLVSAGRYDELDRYPHRRWTAWW